MVYEIKNRTKQIAENLGVQVFPSDNPKYKLEVYDYHGNFITYVGDGKSKGDYPTYLEMEAKGEIPKGYADKRQIAYYNRHGKEIDKLGNEWMGSRSYYAMTLLWS
jgi:hypothetical protein